MHTLSVETYAMPEPKLHWWRPPSCRWMREKSTNNVQHKMSVRLECTQSICETESSVCMHVPRTYELKPFIYSILPRSLAYLLTSDMSPMILLIPLFSVQLPMNSGRMSGLALHSHRGADLTNHLLQAICPVKLGCPSLSLTNFIVRCSLILQ